MIACFARAPAPASTIFGLDRVAVVLRSFLEIVWAEQRDEVAEAVVLQPRTASDQSREFPRKLFCSADSSA